MAHLLDRNRQIPNGLKFLQPETGWQPIPWSSFDTIVRMLAAHRVANPYLAQKHGWATDYDTVANEVDAYNTKLCIQHGWTDFISLGEEVVDLPKSPRPLGGLQAVAVGAETLSECFAPTAPKVASAQAEGRAAVCVRCPKNDRGDWTTFFTVPIANAIREAISLFKSRNLHTSHDDHLRVCSACNCPLPLMVHCDVEIKYKHMTPESKADLHHLCWIRSEMAAVEARRAERKSARA